MLVVLANIAACGSGDDDDDGAQAGSAADGAGKSGGSAGNAGQGSGNAGQGGDHAGQGGDEPNQVDRKPNDGLYGSFELSLKAATPAIAMTPAAPAHNQVLATFRDGPKPPDRATKEVARSGDCALYTAYQPFCECENPKDECTADDTCTRVPVSQNVGTIHLSAGSSELDFKPVNNNYQLVHASDLPYPACEEGATARIEAEGGEYEGFAIETRCIAPLESEGPFPLEPDKPFAVTWSKPGDSALGRMEINLDIAHHGGGTGEIICDVPDTGAYEIDAELVNQLLDLGVAGYPTVRLTRAAVGHPSEGPTNAVFAFSAVAERQVTIPGLVSCDDSGDNECPEGQTCQWDLSCK